MKERPIPFSAPMVRAILAGTKVQTRRVVKPQPSTVAGLLLRWKLAPLMAGQYTARSPYGQPGDRLWVREAWRTSELFDSLKPSKLEDWSPVRYEADLRLSHGWAGYGLFGKLRPGMFMPRWASRITLEVTGVRVERLQDISADDAIAEGIERRGPGWAWYTDAKAYTKDPRTSYRDLWEFINGPGSWDANPWVWVVEVARLEATR